MKRLLLLVIIASAIVAPSAQAPAQAGLDAAIASVDATIAADFAKDGVGGLSIGVVSGKQLVWSKHYGYADAEAKRVADDDTTYRVGSITKQFAQVGASRHGVEEPGVRGHRSQRFPADGLFGGLGVGRTRGHSARNAAIASTFKARRAGIMQARRQMVNMTNA
jgi:hypothetical protein